MIWRRALLLTLLTLTGLALETSLFGRASLAGTKPQLLLLATIALAISEGPELGATAGFTMGLATDLVLGLPKGVTALVYTALGYLAGMLRMQVLAPTAWLPIVMEAAAALLATLLYGAIAVLLGEAAAGGGALARHAALGALYNALLTPFVYPLVRALGGRFRPQRVYRA
jgi:rod shape-determining protein MreD